MFYSRDLFFRKGPLGTVWLAGNYIRKLPKQLIITADIRSMCITIERPPQRLALPAQSTLLKGVVNIESKKAKYLLDDAVEAKGRVRFAERIKTTLEPAKLTAKIDSITFAQGDQSLLPEDYMDLESYSMIREGTEREEISLTQQEVRYRARETGFLARAEDITLSQGTLEYAELGRLSVGLEMEREIELREEPGLELGIGVPLTPTTAISELAPIAEEIPPEVSLRRELEEEEEQERKEAERQAAQRTLLRRRKKLPKVIRDIKIEMSDQEIRESLHSQDDIIVRRPAEIYSIIAKADISMVEMLPGGGVDLREAIRMVEANQTFKMMAQEKMIVEVEEEKRLIAEREPQREEMESLAAISEISLGGISREEAEMGREREARIPMEEEIERERAEFETPSFLGKPLERNQLEQEERRRSRESLALRRVGAPRISLVGELPTPEEDIRASQFEIPIAEMSEDQREAYEAVTRASYSKLTEILLE